MSLSHHNLKLVLGFFMSEQEIMNVLERLLQHLPEKPDWIVLVTVDGEYVAGTNFAPMQKELGEHGNRVPPLTAALNSFVFRMNSELRLGDSVFTLSFGSLGLLWIMPLDDDYVLAMKFAKETSFSSLASVANSLPNMLKELSNMLRENPFTRYSP
jgi:hypothetical protein